MLYRRVSLPSKEPVQFVGVYVLKWGQTDQPTDAFVFLDWDDVKKAIETCIGGDKFEKERDLNKIEESLRQLTGGT